MSHSYKGILKPSSRRRITSKILIDRVEKSARKKYSSLKPSINKTLKSKSNTFKKNFNNRYNRYLNSYIRTELRKKSGKNARKSVKFLNNFGTKI